MTRHRHANQRTAEDFVSRSCPSGKVRYPDRRTANVACTAQRGQGLDVARAYQCKRKLCRGWHITKHRESVWRERRHTA